MGYAPLVYKTNGGDKLVVASGGEIAVESGGALTYNGSDLAAEFAAIDGLLATAAELNRAADVSTRLVAAGATLAVTVLAHDGKIIALNTASGSICTLPAATGSGAIFRFIVTVTPTSNAHIVKVTTTDVMYGMAIGSDDEAPPVGNFWASTSTADTITMDSSTTGGEIGDTVECIDIASAKWAVNVILTQTGTEATPFSATVS